MKKKQIKTDLYEFTNGNYYETVRFHIKNKCDKLSKLEQFYGIVCIDREPDELKKAKDFIDEIRSVKYSIIHSE